MLHTRRKKCVTNCDYLSESSVAGASYLNTQCSTNATATSYAVIRFRGTTCVNLLKRSEITSVNMNPRELFGSGPMMSMANELSGAVAGKSFISLAFLRRRSLFLAHGVHSRTVALMSDALDHCLIPGVPSAQHAVFILEVEGPLSAELSRVSRLAEVIKFLFLHDLFL